MNIVRTLIGEKKTDVTSIPVLGIPSQLPHPNAIASFGSGTEKYETDFWEVEYRVRRSLERVTDSYLDKRYQSILRNLQTLVAYERDVIPIQSGLSSWYWFRKEHQTRLEYHLRGKPISTSSPALYLTRTAPAKPKHPNAGDVLFRYGKREHLSKMLNGSVRLNNSTVYAHLENDEARQDIEHVKKSYLPGAHTRITTMDGTVIPVIGDVSSEVSGPHYYMLCLSSEWDPQLFDAFGVDSCVLIRETETFRNLLVSACASELPNWVCDLIPVNYFDPYEMSKNELFDTAMCKDFSFAYQQEWRFVCCSRNGENASGEKFLATKVLHEVADIFSRDWTK